jgi:GNAT superfamily N-acetyltransferase
VLEAARAAHPDDLARIVELAEQLRAELASMKGGALWLEREAWPTPLETSYSRLLDADDAHVSVGTIDDAVIGYGVAVIETLRSGAALGRVTDLFVEEGARAVGVGECIAADLLTFCVERGCVGVDALALPGHRDAKNFFERNGFTARSLTMHRTLHR